MVNVIGYSPCGEHCWQTPRYSKYLQGMGVALVWVSPHGVYQPAVEVALRRVSCLGVLHGCFVQEFGLDNTMSRKPFQHQMMKSTTAKGVPRQA